MIATMLSMVAVALLVAVLLSSTLHSGGNSSTSVSNAPGVAEADALQAQQSLTTALSATGAALAQAGGFGGVSASALASSDPSISFVNGASSSPIVVSVGADSQGGSVTLADRSADGTCWLVWKSAGATWYGAQTHLASCSAPAFGSPPATGPVTSTAIGWQQGSFPAA